MDLYAAQRTNFRPTLPRLVTEPGQQRQLKLRSANRGKAVLPGMDQTMGIMPVQNDVTGLKPAAMIKKMAAFKPVGV